MWLLTHISDDPVPKQWILIGGKSYVVGRKGSEILIDFDQAVSRKHAVIQVGVVEDNNISNIDILPKISLTDEKAKFGTFIDQVKMKTSATVELKEGVIIQFGTHETCRFKLTHDPLVFCCSGYSEAAKSNLSHSVAKIGHISEDISKCTHILMKEVRITNKLLLGLATLLPIIDETFLEDILETKEYQRSIPNSKGFLPPVLQPELRGSKISYMINPARKTVFEDKTFVCLRNDVYNRTKEIINAGGGEIQQTPQENPSVKSLDAFFTSFSGPIYLVLNIDNQADSYVEMKKKVAITKKKPGIFTVNDIGMMVLTATFGSTELNTPEKPSSKEIETPEKDKSSHYPKTPQSEEAKSGDKQVAKTKSTPAKSTKSTKEATEHDEDATTTNGVTNQAEEGKQTPKRGREKQQPATTKTTPQTDDELPPKPSSSNNHQAEGPEATKESPKKRGRPSKASSLASTKNDVDGVGEATRESPKRGRTMKTVEESAMNGTERSPRKKVKADAEPPARRSGRNAKQDKDEENTEQEKPKSKKNEEEEKEDEKEEEKEIIAPYKSNLFLNTSSAPPPSSFTHDSSPSASPSTSVSLAANTAKTAKKISPKSYKKPTNPNAISPAPSTLPPDPPSPSPLPPDPPLSPSLDSPPSSPPITANNNNNTAAKSSPPLLSSPNPPTKNTSPAPDKNNTESDKESTSPQFTETPLFITPKGKPPQNKSKSTEPLTTPPTILSSSNKASSPPSSTSSSSTSPSLVQPSVASDNLDAPPLLIKRRSFGDKSEPDNAAKDGTTGSGDDMKMVTKEVPLVGSWIATKRFKRANAGVKQETQSAVVPASQFQPNTESSMLQQEWYEQEGKEFEEEMKSGVKADQLFDAKSGGNANPNILSPFIQGKLKSNNAPIQGKPNIESTKPTPSSSSSSTTTTTNDKPTGITKDGSFQEFLKSGKQVQSKLKFGRK